MFKKVTKHVKRRGLTPTKVLFDVHVLRVTHLLPALASLECDAVLSVCFERGGKMSCSTGLAFNPAMSGADGTLEVNQKLSLVATLYQEASGAFQEKTAKLILRQLKTSRLLGNVYKGLGVVSLKLNVLMQDLLTETSKNVAYPMEILKGGAVVTVSISARILSQADDAGSVSAADEVASLISDTSDMSMMGAVFDPEDVAAAATGSEKIVPLPSQGTFLLSLRGLPSTGSSSSSSSSSSSLLAHRPSMTAVHEGDEESEGDGGESEAAQQHSSTASAADSGESTGRDNKGGSRRLVQSARPSPRAAAKCTGSTPSTTANAKAVDGGGGKRSQLLPTPPAPSSSSSSSSSPSSSSAAAWVADREAECKEEYSPHDELQKLGVLLPQRRTAEERELQTRVHVLGQQLESRSRTVLKLQAEMQAEVAAFRNEITGVRADLVATRLELKRERAAREALQTSYVTEDNFLTSFLATAEKDLQVVSAEYAQCCAELQNVEQDLALARQEMQRAADYREEERRASIEAATVAAAASLRRAELEVETDGMIQALIDAKMLSADLALQLEEEKNKTSVLRRRLQRYAERIGAMELSAVIEGLRRKGEKGES